MAKAKSQLGGFTIVELLIVVVVIAILAAIVTVAYNGVTTRASDSAAKSDIETLAKKLEIKKIDGSTYPLTIAAMNGDGVATTSDIRTEYTSDGSTYCVTVSSLKAKTDYYKNNTSGSYATGKCVGHTGYTGAAGAYSSSGGLSIFGASSPPGNYQEYNDGGGSLWVGNRFYTTQNNGISIIGVRVWEPVGVSQAFLNAPLSVQVFTQDWQGTGLGGWNSLGAAAATATFTGTRTAGSWTYVLLNSPVTLAKVTSTAGAKDMATVAVRYDGNYYSAVSPDLPDAYIQSNQMAGVYLSEDGEGDVGRSVSNVYPTVSHAYYYGVDMLFNPL